MPQEEKIYIYGKHAIAEALTSNPKVIKKIFIYQELSDPKLSKLIFESGISVDKKIKDKPPAGISSETHQGIVGVISMDRLLISYDDFINNLSADSDTALVVLGELQDPHNVGAIIRSSAAFGISGVLIPTHNQAPITGAVIKVSAGMAFRIPLVTIGNVNNTIRDLKKRGFWTYGLAGESAQSIIEEKFDAPSVFIIGGEGKGIREKTRDACDILLRIPIDKKCESLNAAAAAGIALYQWSVKHPNAIK